jgi:hypothetical protein
MPAATILAPAVVQHLTLFIYQDLLGSKQFAPSLLNPGGVYTPLDTSWLTEYVQDRPDIDLLLVATLKPTTSDKSSSTITVELDLLDAHTGETKSSWTVIDVTMKEKNAWLDKGQAMVTSAINDRASKYGYQIMASHDFEKQPIGKVTAHLADETRDTLPAHLGGFVRTGADKPADAAGAVVEPCPVPCTRVTYNYKHSVSHSYTLLANNLDQSTTIVGWDQHLQGSRRPAAAPIHGQRHTVQAFKEVHLPTVGDPLVQEQHAGYRHRPGRRCPSSLGIVRLLCRGPGGGRRSGRSNRRRQ